MRPKSFSFVMFCVLAISAGSVDRARAQGAEAGDETSRDPKALLRDGNKLFAEGDYPAAHERFKLGYEVQPNPVFLRSMAYCLLKMLQHERATELLRKYLKTYPRARDRAKIAEIISGLDTVIATRVTITSTPPGAEIYIDTEAGGKVGVTPYKATIEPGKHTVILKHPGFMATAKDFDIAARAEVEVVIPMTVPLRITSVPPGAEVRMDSESSVSLGVTPLTIGVVPGKRTVYLTLAGHQVIRRVINAAPGKEAASFEARMLLGFKVTSIPAGATVVLDGKPLPGKTPLEAGAEPGKHELTVKMASFKPVAREINLVAGQEASVVVKYEGGLLSMRSTPPGATVSIGQLELGTTPVTRAVVPRGAQDVTVAHPDRRTWQGSLSFTDAEVLDADIKLGRPLWPAWVLGGVGVASLVAGAVTGALAIKKSDEANSAEGGSLCYADGTAKDPANQSSCGYSLHNASTATLVTGGVAVAAALVYYLVWGRTSLKTSKARLTASTRAGASAGL